VTTIVSSARQRILIVGGGYVGLYAALALEQRLAPDAAEITIVNPENFMVYQPLLPEVASGSLDARHVVVPLRRTLDRAHLITGRVTAIDHERRRVAVQPWEGEPYEVEYDHVVVGLGSETRALPIPGLVEHAIGFSTVAEAQHLRNRVLGRLEAAAATRDPAARRRALTFVFVGGGYTGVEALGEMEDMARAAAALFPEMSPADQRWVLVEATDRILPSVPESLAAFATEVLRRRGIEVLLGTQLESAEGGCLVLSDGQRFEADTLVWSAGVRPHPLVAESDLAVDDKGRLRVDEFLRVRGTEGAWGAGDCAAVPDLENGGTCPPSAQYAERQAVHLAKNLAATIGGAQPSAFRHKSAGEMITLGRYKGVAELRGRTLTGVLPWLMRRGFYVVKMPSLDRKLRISADWLVSSLFRRDVVSLGSQESPRESFERAADPDDPT
jgi:NADH:ubiquinone reductase (H+-translocating)